MDPAIVSAMAAVLGSLVGGSATVATTWITQRTLSKRELLGTEIRTRETLYGEFIRECSKLVLDSFTHTLDKAEKLLPVYELLNRIRLCASDAVLAEAERDPETDHRTILLAQSFGRRNPHARSVARPRSTQVVRRGMPRRTQIDPRRGVAVQARQVIPMRGLSRVLKISAVESRFERRLILEGELPAI